MIFSSLTNDDCNGMSGDTHDKSLEKYSSEIIILYLQKKKIKKR